MARSTRRCTRSKSRGRNNDDDGIPPPPAAAAAAASESSGEEESNQDREITSSSTNYNHPTEAARRRAERSRAIADREAARLARPERRTIGSLAHASRTKSAVTSTPTGVAFFASAASPEGDDGGAGAAAEAEQWCGPFSVARQMIAKRDEARQRRERELASRDGAVGNGEHHPLDEVMEEVELERKRRIHPSMRWKGSLLAATADDNGEDTAAGKKRSKKKKGGTDNLYVKRQKRIARQSSSSTNSKVAARGNTSVPSLFQHCINFLVENMEHVESLGGMVDSTIRKKLFEELVSQNKLDGEAYGAIAEVGIEALEIVDCALISQDQLSESLQQLIPGGLTVLILGHAGRCFGPKTVQAIIKVSSNKRHEGSAPQDFGAKAKGLLENKSSLGSPTSIVQPRSSASYEPTSTSSSLSALSIGGAYLLKDDDAYNLLASTCHTLRSIEFESCPSLGGQFCQSVATSYSSSSMNAAPLLELALSDVRLTEEHLKLLASTDALRNLQSLKLQRIESLTDDILEPIIRMAGSDGGTLEGINLCHNIHLTDRTLVSIRDTNTHNNLRSLQLNSCKRLSSAGLEAFFTRDIPGLPPPPMLRTLDVGNLSVGVVTDDCMLLAGVVSAMKWDVLRTNPMDSTDVAEGKSPSADSDTEGSAQEKSGAELKDDTQDMDEARETQEGKEDPKKDEDADEDAEEEADDQVPLHSTVSIPGGKSATGGFVYLNLSNSNLVTDTTLEVLAETCSTSLVELDVSFCSSVTNKGLGYLVSKVGRQLSKIHIWGCAQLSEEFLDGHARTDDGSLNIVGAWMKKGGMFGAGR